MRKLYVLFFSLITLIAISTQAQVTGTKNIPGDYASLAAAITDLNTNGVGAGGATINVLAGYTETAPTGGFLLGSTTLNASLSAANSLVIQKSGIGANPLLTAPVGTSTAVDGIFILTGTDFVTIDGINLNDPNTGTPASMEWGYALLNLNAVAPFDGCQNVTIKNCTITLNRTNPNASFGIYANHHTTASTTALILSSTSDLHSNNKFYSNSISNVSFGIFMTGYNAASPYTLYDQNNDIGGSSITTGNTISNFGNVPGFNCFGIYMAYHNGNNASYNTISGTTGPAASTALAYGIYFFGTNSAVTANNNTVSSSNFSGNTGAVAGIYAANTGNISAQNNSVTLTNGGGTGLFYGIYTGSAATVNISSNTIAASTTASTTSTFYLIYDATTGTGETFSNNVFNNININTTGAVYLTYASNSTPNQTVTNNSISGSFTKSGAGGTVYGYYNFGSPGSGTATLTGNNYSNINLTGATAFYGIYQATGTGQVEIVQNNTVSNVVGGSSTLIGIHHNYGAAGSIVSGNTVSNISGTATITGIQLGNATASLGLNVYGNNVNGLSSTGAATVSGIIHTSGANTNIYKNKIYNLQATNASGLVNGLTVAGGTTINVYNNLIGDLKAPAATNTNTINGLNISGGTTVNGYYNTIYLTGTSTGTGFGSSGIFASTTPTVTLRNNLVSNNIIPTGTGRSAAYRRSSATLTSYGNTSNNNMWYSGGNANNVIFFDGTTAYATLSSFQTLVTPRDANSVTEVSTPFLSTSGANANFLHISTTTPTVVESGGASIATYTDDYDGDVRNATTPDIGADELNGIAASACSGTPTAGTISGASSICANQLTVLTLTGFTSATGISIQWQSSTVSGGPYTDVIGATGTNFSTGPLTTGVYYYVAKVTCANGGASATTAEYTVTVNAAPTISVTPGSPSICLGGTGVSLTASGGSTYSWTPATGLSATTGATVTANPTVTTTYTITGTTPPGCSNTATVTVTVNAPPTVSATATQTAVCMNGTTQLLASGAVPGNVTTYAFTAGTGATLDPMTGATTAIGTGDDDTPVATPAAIGFTFPYEGVNYTQFSASPDGWILLGSGIAAAQFTNAMTSATNAPKISAYWDDLATGTTGWVKTVVTGSAPNRILKVEWFVTIPRNTVGAANSTFQMWLYETTGKIEFRYGTMGSAVMSASVGLTGATSTNINSVTISSNTNSTVTANDTNGGQPPSGTIYTFTPPQPSYSWSPSTFLSATNIANPVASNMTATTTYTVTATAASGCTATANVTILVGTALTATASATQTTICSGNSTTVSATPTGGGGPYTYSWSNGASVVSTAQSFSASPGTTTTYTVTVTDACSNTTTASVTVNVNLSPTVAVTPSSPTICAGSTIGLIASGALTYSWSPATGLNVTTGSSVFATPAANTTYTVTGTAANGCTNVATGIITVNSVPAINAVTATPGTICSGGTTQLAINTAPSAYCTPAYTTGTGFGDYITNVTLGTINNTTGASAAPYYTYYNLLNTNLTAGNSYTVTGTINNGGTEYVAVWIDFNQNGVFEASEKLGEQQTLSFSIPFSVPAGALNGVTRMRVRNVYFTSAIDPCISYTYGEVEDYNVTITGGASYSYSWSPSTFLSSTTIANPVASNVTTTTTFNATVSSSIGCSNTIPVTVLVNQTPTPVITPANPTICNGVIQQLTVTSNSVAATKSGTSSTLVTIPDNSSTGANNTIAISGIPAGAVITNIQVSFKATHTNDGDLIINLKGPNNNVLNLVNQRGGTGDNFINTTLSSAGSVAISSGSAPFTGVFTPDGATAIGPTGYTSNVINFTGLYGAPGPNGNWTLAIQDASGGEVGALTSWTITIHYLVADNTVWSPVTNLYTNAGATIAYTGTNLSTVYAKPPTTTTYTVTASTSCSSGTANVTVNVNQPPAITGQPVTLSLCQGNTAVFNVTATGAGLTYQWYFNGNPLSNGGNVSGATSATLTVANITTADAGNYTVVVSGSCTPSPVTSSIAVLSVGTPPLINTQPQSQTACAANTVSFSVVSPGINTYQWYKGTPPTGTALVTDGVHIFGATTATLTITNITAADAGNYYVIVTNGCNFSTTSVIAILTFSTNDRWLGTANSDWNNPNNWCNGVPTPTTDVEIVSGTPFPAILSANGDTRNLQINSGATLTVIASGWLNIWGSTLTQNGTFTTTLGTLSFRNTANLNVPAIIAANVVMNGAGGITLTGNMRVDSALTLTSGNITIGANNLTMKGGTLGSVASHIITNGTGAVTNNNVGVATVVFPVAPNATSYNPVQIASGGGLNYTVRVAVGINPAITNSAIAINRVWTITPSAAPSSAVQLTFGYADADGNAGYSAANRMEAGYYSGTAWTITTGNGGTAAMGTAAARLVYTTSQNFGTGAWVVANVGGLTGIVTGTPNLNSDIYSAKLLPNLVDNQAILRVMSRRAMNIEWMITDIQGRVVMKFNKSILAGQNDINLKLGHLASGTYQVVGYTDKGTTNVIPFVRL
jgi:subtilisin-like proprotein convertase family protein